MKSYPDFGLGDYYLEDSYVLRIVSDKDELTFEMLLVLCESHEDYHEPLPGEKYCYRKGRLSFAVCRNIHWKRLKICPTVDPDGTIDFGNIDSLELIDGKYRVTGEWGEVDVESERPQIDLINN